MHILYVIGMVRGVTCLDSIVYVVCDASSTIRLYNTDTYSPLDDVVINVDGMKDPRDIAVCRVDRQLYAADWGGDCIWRVSADDDHSYVKWLTTTTTDTFHVGTLSLTSRHLLVTSLSRSVRQYSTTNGQLLCDVQLPKYMDVYHAVETTRQTFVVGHRGTSQDKQQHAVSFITYE